MNGEGTNIQEVLRMGVSDPPRPITKDKIETKIVMKSIANVASVDRVFLFIFISVPVWFSKGLLLLE